MSDVWQGPGWWLASDGKWYPADAEPGAVYEGELQNTDQATDVAPTAAQEPQPEPEPQPEHEPEPQPEPEPVVPAEPLVPSFGADPFAQMPAPVIEPLPEEPLPEQPQEQPAQPEEQPARPRDGRGGGWQTVGSDPAPITPDPIPTPIAPEPVGDPSVASVADEDGWTSAYEERSDTADIDPAATIPAAVIGQSIPCEPTVPTMPDPTPVVDVPAVEIPDVQAPPAEIPDVEAPPAEIPEAEVLATASSDTDIPVAEAPVIGQDNELDPHPPIERDGAWRKPSATDDTVSRPAAGAPSRVPEVVDLAIPEPAPEYVPEPQGRNWGLFVGIAVALLLLAALAWVIASALSGDDDNVDTTNGGTTSSVAQPDDGTETTPTSSATAPSTSETATTEGNDNNVSVFALRAGDCIVGDIGAGQVTKVTKVDCEEEHQFEVYREALIEPSITTFDEEAISAYAEEVCRTSLEAYIPPDDERGLKFKFLQPTEDSWNQPEDPDRVITCLLFDDDAPLVGRAA